MKAIAVLTFGVFLLAGSAALAQSQSEPPDAPTPQNAPAPKKQTQPTPPAKQSSPPTGQDPDDILNSPVTPPRSDDPKKKPAADEFPFPEDQENQANHGYSSSKDSQGDIGPPLGDTSPPGADLSKPPDDVTEVKPWNPHEADKDVEVGTFYFHRENYKAAEARFRDALHWQDNHAEATYRLGEVLEKEGKKAEAVQYYQAYLKILPSGPFAADSRKALVRLAAENEGDKKERPKKSTASTFPPS